MLSASFNNQTPNQNLRYNLSDNPMNDYSSNPIGYHENYIQKPDMYNQFYNQAHFLAPGINNYDSKMYSISESDSLFQSSNISNNHTNNNTNSTSANSASLLNQSLSADFNLAHLDQSAANNNGNNISNHINGTNGKDFEFSVLSSRLSSIALKPNCSVSRSNSAHNSPFDNRVTPRPFPQSTSNTPLPLASRLNRDMDMMRGNAPIMQLFPSSVGNSGNGNGNPGINTNQNGNNNGGCCNIGNMNGGSNNGGVNPGLTGNCYSINRSSPVELIEYQSVASKMGFLVGQDLDEVLNRSATMKNSNSSRISNFFKHKHGSSGNHLSQKQYLVLGVRVPSKEHVSEIVGKEGKKIKMIRQTTGALIATPNEKEDHVFLIEAVPETAIKVGQIIQQLADQITRNKLGNITGLMGERPRSPPMLGNRTPLATATIGVPQRLVGKVIGTQGSIITTVQKETGTEIKSPPKDELRAPGDTADFEISVYENGTVNSEETAWLQIHRAKQLIAHLVMRVWDQQPRNSTPSSDEGTGGGSSAPLNCNFSSPEWMWTEVSRMDDGDAKEIIDRILRSSKAKITPSTSSTEGTNIDSLVVMQQQSTSQQAPPLSSSSITQSVPITASLSSSCSGSSSSPPLSQSISAAGGYYKLLPSEDIHWSTTTANRQINNDCCYSTDPMRSRINPHLHNNGLYYSPHQQQYSSSHGTHNHHHLQHSLINNNQYCSSNNNNNDSAFYDSYYPSVYSPPSLISHSNGNSYINDIIDSPTPPPTIIPSHNNNHYQQSIDPSWSKQVFFSSSVNNSNQILHANGGINNSNTSDDNTPYKNLKYLWKNSTHDASLSPSYLDSASVPVGSSSPPSSATSWMPMITNQSPTSNGMIQLRQNNPSSSNSNRVSESLFGTIGDGRKRNSVASNSDDREDL